MMTGVSRIAWRLGSSVESRSATEDGCGVTCTDIAAPLPGAGVDTYGSSVGWNVRVAFEHASVSRIVTWRTSAKIGVLTRYIVQEYRDVTSHKRQRWAGSSAGTHSVLGLVLAVGAFVVAVPGDGDASGSAPAT